MFPTDKAERKKIPIFSGVLMYFPRCITGMAKASFIGNEQHNPGQPLHWAREKSNDHPDCIMRHMMEGEGVDDDGVPHCVKAAWRACARAELILDKQAHQDACDEIDKVRAGLLKTPPPPPETRVDPDHTDIMWKGAKIGYTVGSQSLFVCPHCAAIVFQRKQLTHCSKCEGMVV